jgi:hypothetical protein
MCSRTASISRLLERVEQLLFRALQLRLVREVPVAPDAQPVARAEAQAMGRRQLRHLAEHAQRRGHDPQRQILVQRRPVDLRPAGQERQQTLDLRGEGELAAREAIEEGLLAQVVARGEQALFVLVPDGEGEHPAQAVETCLAHLLVEVQDTSLSERVRKRCPFSSSSRISSW